MLHQTLVYVVKNIPKKLIQSRNAFWDGCVSIGSHLVQEFSVVSEPPPLQVASMPQCLIRIDTFAHMWGTEKKIGSIIHAVPDSGTVLYFGNFDERMSSLGLMYSSIKFTKN